MGTFRREFQIRIPSDCELILFIADRFHMSTPVPEPRTAVMIRVEVSWADSAGNIRSLPARMEDKSPSGACLRVNQPIEVGAKLRVQWRFEQFSGVVKYCRREEWDYIVGILRDATGSLSPSGGLELSVQQDVKTPDPPPGVLQTNSVILQNALQSQAASLKDVPRAISVPQTIVENKTVLRTVNPFRSAHPVRREPDHDHVQQTADHHPDPIPPPEDLGAHRRTRFRTIQPARTKEILRERKSMARKWLELAPWQSKQDSLSVNSAENDGAGENKNGRENSMQQAASFAKKEDRKSESVSGFQVDLLPMEDIYRAAGIMGTRKGYSVHKVVEMLNSDHIAGLAKEMRRAAVLMALQVADISLGQVQQDAKARQDALDCYEAEQTKLIEAEWARKAEENIRIEEELERVKEQYSARVNRNLEAVAREKAIFNRWRAMKQKEVQSISAAVDLCLKRDAPEPAATPPLTATAAAAGTNSLSTPSAPKL
jgi:hypothetical protein